MKRSRVPVPKPPTEPKPKPVRLGRLDANAKTPEIPPGATVTVRLVNRKRSA